MLRRALLAALAVGLVLVPAPAVAAADPCRQSYVDANNKVQWRNVCTEGGGAEQSPAPSGPGPSCYLGRKASFRYDVAYCSGELSCYRYIPPPSAPDPASWPVRPEGTPETAQYANQACFTQPPAESLVTNEYIWVESAAPDPALLIWDAIGALTLPTYTVGFNPPGRAVVGIPTWFWAAGPTGGAIVGGNANGLVGTATPAHLEVDPGDGSGSFTCPWSVSADDTCAHTYTRSSAGRPAAGATGDPAYTARMRLVLDLTFEFNGAPIVLPEAPPTVQTAWQQTAIPVAEVQSLVGPRS